MVQSGDTLSSIAQRFGVSVDQIAQANSIQDVSLIRAGQQLVIPAATGAQMSEQGVGQSFNLSFAGQQSVNCFIIPGASLSGQQASGQMTGQFQPGISYLACPLPASLIGQQGMTQGTIPGQQGVDQGMTEGTTPGEGTDQGMTEGTTPEEGVDQGMTEGTTPGEGTDQGMTEDTTPGQGTDNGVE